MFSSSSTLSPDTSDVRRRQRSRPTAASEPPTAAAAPSADRSDDGPAWWQQRPAPTSPRSPDEPPAVLRRRVFTSADIDALVRRQYLLHGSDSPSPSSDRVAVGLPPPGGSSSGSSSDADTGARSPGGGAAARLLLSPLRAVASADTSYGDGHAPSPDMQLSALAEELARPHRSEADARAPSLAPPPPPRGPWFARTPSPHSPDRDEAAARAATRTATPAAAAGGGGGAVTVPHSGAVAVRYGVVAAARRRHGPLHVRDGGHSGGGARGGRRLDPAERPWPREGRAAAGGGGGAEPHGDHRSTSAGGSSLRPPPCGAACCRGACASPPSWARTAPRRRAGCCWSRLARVWRTAGGAGTPRATTGGRCGGGARIGGRPAPRRSTGRCTARRPWTPTRITARRRGSPPAGGGRAAPAPSSARGRALRQCWRRATETAVPPRRRQPRCAGERRRATRRTPGRWCTPPRGARRWPRPRRWPRRGAAGC
ncbi:LigA [Strigomonas culicis]|uniref:LigA n=1 Tax=Strigomonas culicis TaxID=28005 RepID=S9V1G9_9TRYP|nr:LigA [Strigomonas culicis]|eukprot:EPY16615.1 LigA [Strigomonas culicis]